MPSRRAVSIRLPPHAASVSRIAANSLIWTTRPKVAGWSLSNSSACAQQTSPTRWRRTCAEWEGTVRDWVGAPEADAVLHSQVFFDLRPVHGESGLAVRVQREMLLRAKGSPRFQAHLARIACEWQPPLGFLRGLVVARLLLG